MGQNSIDESTPQGELADALIKSLLASCSNGIVLFDAERLIYANPAASGLLTAGAEAATNARSIDAFMEGLSSDGVFHSSICRDLIDAIRSAMAAGTNFETEVPCLNGRVLKLEMSVLPGATYKLSIEDITDLHLGRIARRVLDDLPTPAYALDGNDRLIYSNKSFDAAITRDPAAKTAAETLEEIRATATGEVQAVSDPATSGSYTLKCAGPETHKLRLVERTTVVGDGPALTLGHLIVDSENEEYQKRLTAVLANIDYGVMFMDQDLNLKLMNDKCLEYWHIRPEELHKYKTFSDMLNRARRLGLFGDEFSDEGDWRQFVAEREAAARFGNTTEQEIRLPDGRTLLYSSLSVGNDRMMTYFDVTHYKKQQDELTAALEHSHLADATLNQIGHAVSIKNAENRYVFINDAYRELFDVTDSDIIGRGDDQFLTDSRAQQVQELDASILTNGKSVDLVETILRANSHAVISKTHKSRVEAPSGDFFLVSVFHDITELKRKEFALSNAVAHAELAQEVIEHLKTPIIVRDEDHRCKMFNKAYLEFFDATAEETHNKRPEETFEPDLAEEIINADTRLLQTGEASTQEASHTSSDGTRKVTEAQKTLVRRSDGNRYTITSIHDVTRYKEQQAQLQEALRTAELSKHVLDQLGSPITVKDSDHRYTMVNDAFAKLFGIRPHEIVGKSTHDFIEPELARLVNQQSDEIFASREPIEFESTIIRPDGKALNFLNRHSFLDSQGKKYVIGILSDVTKLREQGESLKLALQRAELSEAVLDQLHHPVVIKDSALRYVMANEAYCDMLDKDRGEIIAKSASSFFPPELVAHLEQRDRTVLTYGETSETDEDVPIGGGRTLASITCKSLAKTKNGDAFVVTVFNDVTKLKEKEQALKEALRVTELSKLILDRVPTPVAAKDENLKYAIVNKAFATMFNRSQEDFIGQSAHMCLSPDEAVILENMDRQVLLNGELVRTEEQFGPAAQSGSANYISSKSLAVTDSGDRYVIGVITDVSDLKRREKELLAARRAVEEQNEVLQKTKSQAEHDSLHDPLTGLPNRRFLDQRLREWRKGSREKELALLQIDLDRFKAINDTLGHAAGDFILQHVSSVLRENSDENDFVCRIGGDEFIVLRESNVAREELEYLADQIITELSKPVPYENELCRFGASIGIDVGIASMSEDLSHDPTDPSRLMMNADIALYRAKREGRGRFTFFSKDLQKEIERSKRISDDILDGLEKGEFFPVYQPQFDAKSLELVGVETLARWHHPVLGVLAPPAFLDAAKDLGAADQIDHQILEKALADMQLWEARQAPPLRVAVNVSAQRMSNPFLINLLKKLNLPRDRLAFEVHESTMLDHANEDLRSQIRQIADLGIDIEIDNFGTGQSSFLGMWSASPRRIKIDRALVNPIATSEEHKRLLQAVVDMGKSINLEVVSEGVETIQHIKILREMGVDILQGYALAKPMTCDELVEFAFVNQQFALRG
ncbi:PAS domain-containing protein [Roseibium sp.]|uniref:PAS domain-containing protein n=1 Tax=Roseibium sp. TaxID=1936156 RepID=UPI003A98310C